MQVPLQITFCDIPSSSALEEAIQKEASWLDQYYGRVIGCKVIVSKPHRHRHTGSLYSIAIHLTVPGRELVIDREHRLRESHSDPYLAVREAFHAARRALEDQVRFKRGDVKRHQRRLWGRIRRVMRENNCAFIETADGREIYLNRNSLIGGSFDSLQAGDRVTFVEAADQGPNATSVRLVRSRHSSSA
jgi:cold shock CspA family protein/ribosome-associated translation inhibitor RaiA